MVSAASRSVADGEPGAAECGRLYCSRVPLLPSVEGDETGCADMGRVALPKEGCCGVAIEEKESPARDDFGLSAQTELTNRRLLSEVHRLRTEERARGRAERLCGRGP